MSAHFMAIVIALLIGGAVGYLVSGWLGALAVGLVIVLMFLIYHLIYINQLKRWLNNPKLSHIPHGMGVWADIFDDLMKQAKNRKKSKQKLANALSRFNQIAKAMPNGVILLDEFGRMEWFNPSASQHLQLKENSDQQGILKNIIRQPEFHRFLDNVDDNSAIKMAYHGKHLLISQTALANQKRLLVSQDISISEQLNQTQTDFVANVSHELRTPLTVISGFTETLLENSDLPLEQRQEFLGLMQQENTRILNLIKDLLTLSRLEHAHNHDDDKEPLNLSELLGQIVQDAQKLSQNQHEFMVDIQDDVYVLGVALDLHNALSNLVFNAVRYTPNEGKISVMLHKNEAENRVKFSVSDTGAGIAPEHIPRLTERFYRVDKGRHRQSGGTGLGLAISKQALAKHNSQLHIESKIGVGSTFSAEFDLLDNELYHAKSAELITPTSES